MRVYRKTGAPQRHAPATSQWRRICAAGIAFTLLFVPASLAHAQEPKQAQDCAATLDRNAPLCGAELPDVTFDAFASPAQAPPQQKLKETAASPAETPAPMPFSLNATGESVTARTSLGNWRDYNAQLNQRKIDDAKSSVEQPVTAPKPAATPASPFEIWSSVDAQGAESETGQVKARAGADYKFGASTTAGVIAERGGSNGKPGSGLQSNEKLGAYVTTKPLTALSIEARTQWEKNDSGLSASGPAAVEKNSITVAPSIRQPFAIGGGKTVEPYVTLKHEFDAGGALQGGPHSAVTSADSAGAGVTFAKPGDYSLSLSTDVDGIAGEQPASVKSQMQFKLPLH